MTSPDDATDVWQARTVTEHIAGLAAAAPSRRTPGRGCHIVLGPPNALGDAPRGARGTDFDLRFNEQVFNKCG